MKAFSKHVVSHNYYKGAVDSILNCIDTTASRREPASTLLTGPAGVGKTTVCKYVVQKIGAGSLVETEWGTVQTVPAFYCGVPAGVTLKSLSMSMLIELGCTQLSGDGTTLLYRLMTLLHTCQTQVIMLDEFHHLLARGAEKTKVQVCDWIKTLMNETLIPVILVGMPECEAIIDDHPQLARRYPFRAHLQPLAYSFNDARSDYIKTLKSFSFRLKELGHFESGVHLTDQHVANSIYVATSGNMNSIRQLLHEAFKMALARDNGEFSLDDLTNSFGSQKLEGSLIKHGNPFLLDPQDIKQIISRHAA